MISPLICLGGSRLNARYSQEKASPRYLSPDAQAIRWPGHPAHLKQMKALGNTCKLVISHGVKDESCLVEDAKELAANMHGGGAGG